MQQFQLRNHIKENDLLKTHSLALEEPPRLVLVLAEVVLNRLHPVDHELVDVQIGQDTFWFFVILVWEIVQVNDFSLNVVYALLQAFNRPQLFVEVPLRRSLKGEYCPVSRELFRDGVVFKGLVTLIPLVPLVVIRRSAHFVC